MIEEPGDVRVKSDPIPLAMKRQHSVDRVMATAARTEPERTIVKQQLKDRLKKPTHHFLSHSISYSRDSPI